MSYLFQSLTLNKFLIEDINSVKTFMVYKSYHLYVQRSGLDRIFRSIFVCGILRGKEISEISIAVIVLFILFVVIILDLGSCEMNARKRRLIGPIIVQLFQFYLEWIGCLALVCFGYGCHGTLSPRIRSSVRIWRHSAWIWLVEFNPRRVISDDETMRQPT